MKIAQIADSMQQEIEALSRARRGGVAATKGSERFADAVSQIFTKDGAKDAPTLSGFLEHAQQTKDAMSLFGRKATQVVEAAAKQVSVDGTPRPLKPLMDVARKYPDYNEFKANFTKELENPKVSKAQDAFMGGSKKGIDAGFKNTSVGNFLKDNEIDGFRSLHEFANRDAGAVAAKFAESTATPEEKIVAKAMERIPTGRQPATIPIKAENVTSNVDAEVFINTKILPLITGAERIAKSNEEIITRALSSDLTEKDFNNILTERFGNMSEDVVKAKQFMTDGAMALKEALAGRSIAEIPAQEAKDIISQYNRVVQTFEVFAGVRTELSNSFRALGLAVNPGENDTLQTALEAIQKSIGDAKDPFEIAKAMMQAQKSSAVEKYFKIWYPAVLSGPKTQVRLMLGDAGGVTIQALSTLFTSEGRASFLDRVAGMVNGQKEAVNYAMRVFRGEDTIYSNYYEPAIPKAREFKGAGAFFEAVGGFMEGVKGYFAKTYELGEIAALEKGGYTYGLQDKGVIDSLNEAVGKVASQTATYINPGEATTLGTINKALQNLKSSDKATVAVIARFLAPFTKIVTNITDRAIDFTPIINLGRTFGDSALYEGRADRILATAAFKDSILQEAATKGLDAAATKNYLIDETARVKDIIVARLRDQQMGRFYMGIAATGAMLPLAIAGRITGNGPSDANQKALLEQTGWRPDSIILPDGTAMPYDNFLGPLKLALAITGNISDSIRFKSDATGFQAKILDGFISFTKSELDQSFLSGITNFIDTLSGNKSPSSFFNTLAVNAIPIPALYTQAKDTLFPERYNAASFNDALRMKLGITGSFFGLPALTPKTDALGNPIKADLIYGSLPPIGNEAMKDDPLYKFMAQNDAFVGKPSPNLVIKGNQKGQERPITPEEYAQYVQDSGKEIYAKLSSKVDAGYFDKFTNKKEIKNAIDAIAQPIRTKYKNKIRY